jgi:hypothetical protein
MKIAFLESTVTFRGLYKMPCSRTLLLQMGDLKLELQSHEIAMQAFTVKVQFTVTHIPNLLFVKEQFSKEAFYPLEVTVDSRQSLESK